MLFLRHASKPVESPSESHRNRSERHVEHECDVAISKSFRSQAKTLAVEIGQSRYNGVEGAALLEAGRALLWIRGRIGNRSIVRRAHRDASPLKPLQGDIPRYAENPSMKIVARLAGQQMPK
jgi:hypothetical protein